MISRSQLFVGLIMLIMISCFPVFAHLAGIWLTSSAHHHGVLALPVAAILILRNGIFNRGQPISRADLVTGLVWAIPALLLLGLGSIWDIKAAGHLGVTLALIAAFIASFGVAEARRHAFALTFALFMVPVGDLIIPPLQDLTASAIVLGFNILGMEITRDGFLLTTSAGRFDVAEACAGIRFLMAALMGASLFAYLRIANRTDQVRFVAIAALLALIANCTRAFSMVLVATLSDMRLATGIDHYYFGWLIYLIMFIAIFAIGNALGHQRERPSS